MVHGLLSAHSAAGPHTQPGSGFIASLSLAHYSTGGGEHLRALAPNKNLDGGTRHRRRRSRRRMTQSGSEFITHSGWITAERALLGWAALGFALCCVPLQDVAIVEKPQRAAAAHTDEPGSVA